MAVEAFLAARLLPFLAAPLVAFLVALFLTPLVGQLARHWGWLDRPGGVKAHREAMPFGGGIAILLALVAALAWQYGAHPPAPVRNILLASVIVFLGGIWDDVRPLGIVPKFAIQLLAAVAVMLFGVHLAIRIFPLWLNLALTVVWIVGMTNAFNLIDIMDGLAGGVGGIAALAFGLIGLLFRDASYAVLSLALAGSLSGFLAYNFRPASIFMGDTGSQVIGFLLATTAVLGSYTTFNQVALLAPLLILGVPLYDTFLVSLIRMHRGESPFKGSRDHVALRLRALGFSVPATVRILVLMTAALAVAATVATLVPLLPALGIYGVTVAVALGLGAWLARVKVP